MEFFSSIFDKSSLILVLIFLFPLKHRPLSRVVAILFAILFLWDLNFSLAEKGIVPQTLFPFIDNLLGVIFMPALYYYSGCLIEPENKVTIKFLIKLFLIPAAGVTIAFFTSKSPLTMEIIILTFYSGIFFPLMYKGINVWRNNNQKKYLITVCFLATFITSGWLDVFFNLNLTLIYSLVMMGFSLGVFYNSAPEKKRKTKELEISGHLNEIDTLLKLRMKEQLFTDPDITLGSVSEELGTTSHQLSNFLNNYYGQNFNDYINTFRIEKAKKLLIEERKKTVLEIGFEVGFNSSSTFYKAFQRKVGMAPGKYRNLQRNISSE